ncbi:MAG: hypothetical protein JWQ64_3544 [Subtercola sp.]|jgi:hypothetical protein|nr:hypothetical protein [Subtercola sp.]
MALNDDSPPELDELRITIASLESRLAALENERAILAVLSRYAYYADAGLDDKWVDLFTEAGVMDMATGGGDAYGAGLVFTGRSALESFIGDPLGHHRPGFYRQSMHAHTNNSIVKIDGDSATATTYSILLKDSDGQMEVSGAGINEWMFERHDGEWKLALRRRRQVGHPATAELLSATEED